MSDHAFGDRIARLWWAAPVTMVALGAVGATVVFAPTIGMRAAVPSGLSVPMQPTVTARPTPAVQSSAPAPAPAAAPARHHAKTAPKPTPSVVSTSPPSASVVVPQRPLVTASADDRYDSSSPGVGQEVGDR